MSNFPGVFDFDSLWIVKWKDAVNYSHRAQITDINNIDLAVNTNVGWIMDENESRIILVHGFSDTGELDYFAIPTSCVVEKIQAKKKIQRKR